MLTIKMDERPLKQLENDLDRFGAHSLPYAIRDTLNNAAFEASEQAKRNIGTKFVERNTWSRRSVQYRKTFARRIDDMESSVGSTLDYLREQEEGFTTQKTGKHGVAIPTSAASGEGKARIRKRPIRAGNRLSRLRIAKGLASEYERKYSGNRQRLIRLVQDSIEYGFRTIFWTSESSGRTGFYKITGGRRTKKGWPDGAKIEMLYQVDKPSTRTEPHEWLEPAAMKIRKNMDKIYRDALIRQIQINRNFRDRG